MVIYLEVIIFHQNGLIEEGAAKTWMEDGQKENAPEEPAV